MVTLTVAVDVSIISVIRSEGASRLSVVVGENQKLNLGLISQFIQKQRNPHTGIFSP